MTTPPPKKFPKIELSKHPAFRVVHINGFFGGLSPTEGRITFFTDILELAMKTNGTKGEMEVEKVNRESQIDLRMSVLDFVGLAQWMNTHVKGLEEKGILKKEDLAQPRQTDYSV